MGAEREAQRVRQWDSRHNAYGPGGIGANIYYKEKQGGVRVDSPIRASSAELRRDPYLARTSRYDDRGYDGRLRGSGYDRRYDDRLVGRDPRRDSRYRQERPLIDTRGPIDSYRPRDNRGVAWRR